MATQWIAFHPTTFKINTYKTNPKIFLFAGWWRHCGWASGAEQLRAAYERQKLGPFTSSSPPRLLQPCRPSAAPAASVPPAAPKHDAQPPPTTRLWWSAGLASLNVCREVRASALPVWLAPGLHVSYAPAHGPYVHERKSWTQVLPTTILNDKWLDSEGDKLVHFDGSWWENIEKLSGQSGCDLRVDLTLIKSGNRKLFLLYLILMLKKVYCLVLTSWFCLLIKSTNHVHSCTYSLKFFLQECLFNYC